jgi:hypothetical protein
MGSMRGCMATATLLILQRFRRFYLHWKLADKGCPEQFLNAALVSGVAVHWPYHDRILTESASPYHGCRYSNINSINNIGFPA